MPGLIPDLSPEARGDHAVRRLAIMLAVLAFNLVREGLRDALDPRLGSSRRRHSSLTAPSGARGSVGEPFEPFAHGFECLGRSADPMALRKVRGRVVRQPHLAPLVLPG